MDLSVREQYEPIPRLTGPDGKCGNVVNFSEMQDTSMVAITDKCKYPEVVASLVNYCMDPEISITLNWGAVGYTYVFRRDELELFRPSPNPQANAGKYPHYHPCPLRFSE